MLIRKAGFSLVFLVLVAVGAVFMGSRLPTSFLPEEDQGYLYVAMQLPDASSLQRTSEAAKQVENVMLNTPGVASCISVIGFSLLSQVQNTYSAFFFVPLKDWDQRKKPEEQFKAIQAHMGQALSQIKEGIAFSFQPPSIPGLGTSGGVTFVLEDRSGGTPEFFTNNVNKFVAAIRKRPELVGVGTTYLPNVPQLYADVDREKVSRQGVNIGDVYTTMQTFMGGYLVNYFNRFGRQWQVYVEAEGDYRTRPDDVGQFYVFNNKGGKVPLSAVTSLRTINGPEFDYALQRISSDRNQRRRRAGLQFRPGDEGARRSIRPDDASRNGIRLYGDVVSGTAGREGHLSFRHLWPLAAASSF